MTDHSLETSSLLQTQTKLIHLFYLHFTISWDQFTRNEWKREMEWSCQKLRRVEKKSTILLTCVDSLFFMRTVAHVPLLLHRKNSLLYFVPQFVMHWSVMNAYLLKLTFLTGISLNFGKPYHDGKFIGKFSLK